MHDMPQKRKSPVLKEEDEVKEESNVSKRLRSKEESAPDVTIIKIEKIDDDEVKLDPNEFTVELEHIMKMEEGDGSEQSLKTKMPSFIDVEEHMQGVEEREGLESDIVAVSEDVTIRLEPEDSDKEGDLEDIEAVEVHPRPGTSNDFEPLNIGYACKAILDGTFFEVVPEKCDATGLIVAVCKRCTSQRTEVKGSFNSCSSFTAHVKRAHGYAELSKLEKHRRRYNRERNIVVLPIGDKGKSKKKCKCSFTREQLEKLLVDYAVNTLLPLKTLDDDHFRAIVDHICTCISTDTVFRHRSLCKRIAQLHSEDVQRVERDLQGALHVCTSVDVWSTNLSRFVNASVHWIDVNTLERKSAAIACRRFPKSYTHDKVSHLLAEINTDFNLNSSKITSIVTDNGTNFVKSFKEYGYSAVGSYADDLEFEKLPARVLELDERFNPTHVRSNTLSLLATVDVLKAIKGSTFESTHKEALRKCSALWACLSHSKSADVIQKTLEIPLMLPDTSKCSSMHCALSQILNIRHKLSLLNNIGLSDYLAFTEKDIAYLQEHVRCLEPLATALDKLQKESNNYYGYLLPCLLELRHRIRQLLEQDHRFSAPIVNAMAMGLDERFGDLLGLGPTSHCAVIAALSHPAFKSRWFVAIKAPERHRLKALFIKAVISEYHVIHSQGPPEAVEDDFDFGPDVEGARSDYPQAEIEVLRYLSDNRRDLAMLNEYPHVKKVFVKYNTPLPSSVPVERLFCFNKIRESLHHRTDELFEERVILMANRRSA